MILKVNTPDDIYLNIRNGQPSTDAPVTNRLKNGDSVDVIDVVPGIGTPIDGYDIWYKSNDGSFYWAKGFYPPPDGFVPTTYIEKKIEFLSDETQAIYHCNSADENKWKVSWGHVDMGIWKIWKKYSVKGTGLKVAVIDTGTSSTDNDLKGQIDTVNSFNCFGLSNVDDSLDSLYHGTKSSGIIAANASNAQIVYGVAPDCKLVIYKLYNNENLDGYTDENFCFLLQQARKAGVDVISMSFEKIEKPDNIEQEIQACLDQNIFLIASCGDENQILGKQTNYPASLPGCISVGAYKLTNGQREVYAERSCRSDSLFCLAPGDAILTCDNTNKRAYHQYTSAAAPFVAGVVALIISYLKIKKVSINEKDIKNKLQSSCSKIANEKNRDEIEGYGIIDLNKLFNLF